MANEITVVELTNSTGFPRRFTCASGVAIAKGALLGLAEPRTASGAPASGAFCCGIASMDKSATDDSTSITAWTDFIGTATASGAIVAGNAVRSAGENKVGVASFADGSAASIGGSVVIGYALDDIAAETTGNVRFRF